MRYEHDIQDAINILWTAYSCPWNFNCLFTSRSDNHFIISGHILQGKFLFLLKYKSTVSHSPIEWAYYASGIGKPDMCCYCAAEGIQQDNDL